MVSVLLLFEPEAMLNGFCLWLYGSEATLTVSVFWLYDWRQGIIYNGFNPCLLKAEHISLVMEDKGISF